MQKKDQNNLARNNAENDEIKTPKQDNKYPVWEFYTPGRPTICTLDMIRNICEPMLQMGAYAVDAAQAMGIGERTYYDWISWGERDLEQGKSPSPDAENFSIYAAFSQSVKQARAIGRLNLLKKAHDMADRNMKTWAMPITVLERTAPEQWSARQQIDVTHTVSGPAYPTETPKTHEDWLALREAERKMLQAQASDAEYKDSPSEDSINISET